VNYIYGTGGVLRALDAVGIAARDYAQRAAVWLRDVQNNDGGYGESIASYNNESVKAIGESTASQTAWGLIGLLAAGEREALAGCKDPNVSRAVEFLLHNQQPNGSWEEAPFAGTGFPKVFYLKYHLYRDYFPVYALARYRNVIEGQSEYHAVEYRPEEFRYRKLPKERGNLN
jgi:squalene-hopene/tetraprenyl-beta-curcumene cyclase